MFDVRACADQYPRRFERALAGSKEKRRQTTFAAIHKSAAARHFNVAEIELPGAGIDLSAVIDQDFGDDGAGDRRIDLVTFLGQERAMAFDGQAARDERHGGDEHHDQQQAGQTAKCGHEAHRT